MKRLLSIILVLSTLTLASAKDFNSYFKDVTIKIDLKVVGQGPERGISIDSMDQWKGWWGRRVNMKSVEYPETLTYAVIDPKSGDTIYVDNKFMMGAMHATPERPAYASILIPMPKRDAIVSVSIGHHDHALNRDFALTKGEIKHAHKIKKGKTTPYTFLRKARDPKHAVTIALVAEGYTQDDMPAFMTQAHRLDSAMMQHAGFKDCSERFNIVAVQLASPESGISRPSKDISVNTALKAHFDSFNLDRLVTIPESRLLWNALAGVPSQHVIILANTETYGGSGSYKDYCIGSAANPWWEQMLLHEFGHSFINLGDEYESGYDISFTPDREPLEPNITTLHDFSHKWQNLIDSGEAGLIEGAGYQEKGVWRGCEHCLMRELGDMEFCPVCRQAIIRTIDYYTQER